jgi:superfamily I DNA/RNA helicase
VRKRVWDRRPDFDHVVFTWAVAFPFVSAVERVETDEWLPWQLITENDLEKASIGEVVKSVLAAERDRLLHVRTAQWFDPEDRRPTPGQCDAIGRELRPDFELCESPASARRRRLEELRRFTEEQFVALDAMEGNRRVLFTGPAGTGKTVLALEGSRRCAIDGNRVLLVCFNQLLARSLADQAAELGVKIEVRTVHSLMVEIAGLAGSDVSRPGTRFWNEELPQVAVDRLLDSADPPSFDVLIVDEGQDVLRSSYLDVLDLLIVGGLAEGCWRVFADFENQAIFTSGAEAMSELLCRVPATPTYALRVNCRNTPRVSEQVQLLGGLDPAYARVLRPDDGLDPRLRYYSPGRQSEVLEEVVDALVDDGFLPSDIVVLSFRNDGSCAESLVSSGATGFCLAPLRDQGGEESVRFGTVHSFKGLESPCIVLTDVEEVGSARTQSLLYTGMTRATDRLAVLINEKERDAVLKLLTGGRM